MKKSWYKNFKNKFKIVILHPDTYEQEDGFSMSKMKFFSLIIIYSLLLIIITTCIIFFTPIREFIPGYTDVTLSERVYKMERRADSLEMVFHQQDVYIENLKRIINDDEVYDKELATPYINIARNIYDPGTTYMPSFFVPLNGLVTNHFDSNNKHFGVDVVANDGAVIKAVADGVVVFSDWSVSGGYVIGIQHNMNIISIYKHNSSLLHHEGDIVKAGDPIAIVGNGGSLSTGPHLHFEMWLKGHALNPEDYISFERK